MNNNFWKKILSRAGLVFLLLACVSYTIIIVSSLSQRTSHTVAAGEVLSVLFVCILLTVLIMLPIGLGMYGKGSRISDANTKPENHTAFKGEENANRLISFGDLLSNSWEFYRKNFKKMWVLFLLGGMGTLFIGLAYFGFMICILLSSSHMALMMLAFVLILLLVVFFVFSRIALYKGISDIHKNEFGNVSTAFGKSAKIFWPFLLLTIALFFALSGADILFIIPGIILFGYTFLAQIALVDKGSTDLEAIAVSWNLIKNYWWRTMLRMFGVYVLFGLFIFAFEILLGIFSTVCLLVVSIVHIAPLIFIPLALLIILAIVIVVCMVIEPLLTIATFELYYSLIKVHAVEPVASGTLTTSRKTILIIAIIIGIIISIFSFYNDTRVAPQNAQFFTQLKAEQQNNRNITPDEAYFSSVASSSMLAASSTDLQAIPYVSTLGKFEINLPLGWSLNQDSSASTPGIDSIADFIAPYGQQSDISIAKIDTMYVRGALPASTSDNAIALKLAQTDIGGMQQDLTSQGFVNFQVSPLEKQLVGSDTAYVFTGSATATSSSSVQPSIVHFELLTVFSGKDGYQILGIWPTSEYGISGIPFVDSFATFKILQ